MGIRARWRAVREPWPRWARVLSSGWIVWPFGIVSLLIVSLVTYGALTTAGPPKPSVGGAFGAPTSSPTSGSLSGSLLPTVSPSSTISPPGASASLTPGVQPERGGGAKTFALPMAGAYRVKVEGTEGVKLSAFGFCNRSFPSTTTLYVKDDYDGRETPTSFEFDIAYSSLHSERHIYRYTPGSVFLDFEFAQVSCAGKGRPTEVDFKPPQEKIRLPLRVGASWSGRGGDAQRTEAYTSKVLRTETLAINGRDVSTFVIETSVQMTGSEHGSRLQRWWYAPSLALPVRWHEEYDAAQGPASYQASVTVTFIDLDPS